MDPSGRKVYICNKGGHNFESAKQYGELVYITEGIVNRFATSSFYRAFVEAMKDSSPEDYFLVTSIGVLNAIGASVFARMHGRLNILLYREGEYIVRELDIDSLLDPEEIKASIKINLED